jgi:hypothetical protein
LKKKEGVEKEGRGGNRRRVLKRKVMVEKEGRG